MKKEVHNPYISTCRINMALTTDAFSISLLQVVWWKIAFQSNFFIISLFQWEKK